MIGAVLSAISAVRLKNLFIVLFFGVQLYLAIPGFLYNRYETQGRFSWNMYATVYQCRTACELVHSDGTREPIEDRKFLHVQARRIEFLNRTDLPQYNKYLCDTIPRRGPSEALHVSVTCKLNYQKQIELVQQGVDVCTAPNYGVLPP